MSRPPLEAVALEYGHNNAPVVVAKGHAEVAQQILAEARRQGVYVSEDPQLVALLGELDLDQEIPPHLYRLVGVVLSWAYWLKGMRPGDEKQLGKDEQEDQ
jgi:flagellar biosynthesis protein